MRCRVHLSYVASLAIMLAACAGSTTSYQPPAQYAVQTERRVALQFDEAWDRYVAELSKSFYVINNISKKSRIINVSLSTVNSWTVYRLWRDNPYIHASRYRRTDLQVSYCG